MKHGTSNESFDTSDLTNRLLAMPQVLKVGTEKLNYDFRYDSQAKQVQVTYEFTMRHPSHKRNPDDGFFPGNHDVLIMPDGCF